MEQVLSLLDIRSGSVSSRSRTASLHKLLREFSAQTGYGVLCNTSLNHLGKGFLNTMSELLAYCGHTEIQEVVVGDIWHRRLWP
jgi:hydroxymethyl cephem carbamoyltransferase